MRVAIFCERSGAVRDAFIARGHHAVSIDLAPTEFPGPHIVGDVTRHLAAVDWTEDVTRSLARAYGAEDVTRELAGGWDLVIAFPPCRFLTRAGAHLWREREAEALEAFAFVQKLWSAPCERMALENPVGLLSRLWRPADQYIEPWWFGHPYTKKTGLWLRGLPKLRPVDIRGERISWVKGFGESSSRAVDRARTFSGVADAMAAQWG